MKMRRLGSDGPWVSEIGLGGMYLSIPGRPSEADAVNTIRAALDAGVTFIDTANVYCEGERELGHNERLIAKALRGYRGKVVVGTKGGMHRPNDAWTIDGRPEVIRRSCEESLRALDVEAIDLYQLHRTDPNVPLEDTVGELSRLRDEGKVRWVGLSNVTLEQLERARKLIPIASVQNRWNPHDRSPEQDGVLALCTREQIAFLPYSPFAGAGGSVELARVGRLGEVAQGLGVSIHRMILGWMLAKSPVVIPIPGARRARSIADSAIASELTFTAEQLGAIEAAMP